MSVWLAIIGLAIAVPGFLSPFIELNNLARITIAVSIVIIGWLMDKIITKIRNSDSTSGSRFLYWVQKTSRNCKIIEHHVCYERLDSTHWRHTKRYHLQPIHEPLRAFDDRFMWSSDSSSSNIIPTEKGQEITGIHLEHGWTAYAITFDSVQRRQSVWTGSSVVDLNDERLQAKPFLTVTALPKTKNLFICVKLPSAFAPTSAQLFVYAPGMSNAPARTEKLSYNTITHEIAVPVIKYPRAGWRYVISWQ